MNALPESRVLTADASSKRAKVGLRKKIRAQAMRCFSPPERTVSHSSGVSRLYRERRSSCVLVEVRQRLDQKTRGYRVYIWMKMTAMPQCNCNATSHSPSRPAEAALRPSCHPEYPGRASLQRRLGRPIVREGYHPSSMSSEGQTSCPSAE